MRQGPRRNVPNPTGTGVSKPDPKKDHGYEIRLTPTAENVYVEVVERVAAGSMK